MGSGSGLLLLLISIAAATLGSTKDGSAMKGVKAILPRPSPHWVGDGFHVFPVFADRAFTEELSPFLMFDYAAPRKFPANNPSRLGVGQHPHRGFETITIAFQGEVEHADSIGNRGVIKSGDVQWMTAGRGIVHEEFHSQEFAKAGGNLEMCQLWLNLPAEHKMTRPNYQSILHKDIPTSPLYLHAPDKCGAPVDLAAGGVRVIAGTFMGVKGPASTFTQVDMWDISIENIDIEYEFETVEANNVIIFVRQGSITVQGEPCGPQGVALMKRDGHRVVIVAKEPNTQVLLLAGAPLNEPISAQGPFVMNSAQEIRQANVDFRSGNFGR